MTTATTTCPAWCEKHTTEEGTTYHEANVDGGGWDLILTHEATREGTTISVGLARDPLTPSEALALGVALVEAVATVGQAKAEQETTAGPATAFADVLASELRRGGWNLTRGTSDARSRITPTSTSQPVDALTSGEGINDGVRQTYPILTTERVRRTFAYGDHPASVEGFTAAGESFDAWLAAHDAELLAHHASAGA